MSCNSASACTVVGDQYETMLAERWNGTAWTLGPALALPAGISGSEFPGVSCTTGTDCSAVGSYEADGGWRRPRPYLGRAVERDGLADTLLRKFSPLSAVSCTSTGECIAVGVAAGATLAERYA